ncbi:MAG: hypothetical protein EOR00_09430 [Mesorhizobium sp.]|uniref:hypothetical protein n=1 Tax=Mesorhizobium sp. TaxID=1871066 RepID=UPI000FE5FE4A|nr:hypothetical protein [Mesorhizobium sp.]RWP18849.1 MAG: hypothetical protein EOR00_09430 [Mesorhizobium sp.]
MKTLIASIVARFARTPSTENAIAGFTKALDELEAVVVHQSTKADLLDGKISALIDEQTAAKEAANRADKIAKRFSKLVA